jgi:hypothetical protein
MPVRIPIYRRHKVSGQAVVSFLGRDVYLGKHGSEASQAEYRRLIAECVASDGQPTRPNPGRTVSELMFG